MMGLLFWRISFLYSKGINALLSTGTNFIFLGYGCTKLICKYLIFHEDAPHVCQMFNITIILFNLTGNLEGQEIW